MKILITLFSVISIYIYSICSSNKKKDRDPKEYQLYTTKSEVPDIADSTSYVFKSYNYGLQWQKMNIGLPIGTRISFVRHIGDDLVVATDNFGLFLLEANKDKCVRIDEGLPNRKINALFISGEDIFVGVYRQGLYKSSDLGKSWISLNYNLKDLKVQSIIKIGRRLLVGTDTGIFEFSDSNKSWFSLFVGPQINSLCSFHGEIVAGTSQGAIQSKNQGSSWDWIMKKGAINNVAVLENKLALLHMSGELFISNYWGGFDKSDYNASENPSIYKLVKIKDYWIMSSNSGIHRSNDNGRTWEHVLRTEYKSFFDFLVKGDVIYGGVTRWKTNSEKPKLGSC